MLEIPLNFILINPVVNILIFLTIIYFFIFKYYKKLLKNEFQKIAWIDFQLSIIFLLLGYLNYYETSFEIFGWKIKWWIVLVISQIIVEGIYIIFYWKEWKLYNKKIKQRYGELEKDKLENLINKLSLIKGFMEEDERKYRVQGNQNAEKRVKTEIQKIDEEILKLEGRLKKIKDKKND